MKPIAPPLRTIVSAPPRARRSASRVGTLRELTALFSGNGRFWLVPMVAVLAATALLLAAVTAVEYIAPFVYTIF